MATESSLGLSFRGSRFDVAPARLRPWADALAGQQAVPEDAPGALRNETLPKNPFPSGILALPPLLAALPGRLRALLPSEQNRNSGFPPL